MVQLFELFLRTQLAEAFEPVEFKTYNFSFFLTLNQLQRDYILKMTISERSSGSQGDR